MTLYLLDTNICIYAINKQSQRVVDTINSCATGNIALSAVSIAELEYGAAKSKNREKNRAALIKFTAPFRILPFDDKDAEYFGIIRAALEKQGKVIGVYDMQIAAQGLRHDLTVVTNNTDEFARVNNLKLANWI